MLAVSAWGTIMVANVIRLDLFRRGQPEPELRIDRDDFSVKIACKDDPLFWIRMEVPTGRRLHVTDFKRAGLPRSVLAKGLVNALETLGIGAPEMIHFSNIVPRGEDDPHFARLLTEAIEDVRVACEHVARTSGLTVVKLDANPVGSKVHADAYFDKG